MSDFVSTERHIVPRRRSLTLAGYEDRLQRHGPEVLGTTPDQHSDRLGVDIPSNGLIELSPMGVERGSLGQRT